MRNWSDFTDIKGLGQRAIKIDDARPNQSISARVAALVQRAEAQCVPSRYRSGPPRIGLLDAPAFRLGLSFKEKFVVFRLPDLL